MNGLYTEYSNLTPYHINWLDGCGKSWVGNGSAFSKYIPNEASVCYSILTNSFEKCRTQYYEENDYTHCPTGDTFCQGIAEILGIEYVPEKVAKDKAFPGRSNTMGEGSLTQEDVDILLGDSIVKPIKGMAIEVSRLSEKDRGLLIEWLNYVVPTMIGMASRNENGVNHVGYGDSFGWATKDWYQNNGYTITESPTEFLKYVAQQTGKEYKVTVSEQEARDMASDLLANLKSIPPDIGKVINERLFDMIDPPSHPPQSLPHS